MSLDHLSLQIVAAVPYFEQEAALGRDLDVGVVQPSEQAAYSHLLCYKVDLVVGVRVGVLDSELLEHRSEIFLPLRGK